MALLLCSAAAFVPARAGVGDDGNLHAVDPALRDKHLAERFPGVREIRHLHLLAAPEPRRGACWSELTKPKQGKLSLRYTLEGAEQKELHGLEALLQNGWSAVYRTPLGEGVERGGPFRSLELSYESELRCRCAPRGEIIEGEARPIRLRYRWSAGERPEVSASSKGALTPLQTYGSLVSYAFEVEAALPKDQAGRCAAAVTLTTLVDPPIR